MSKPFRLSVRAILCPERAVVAPNYHNPWIGKFRFERWACPGVARFVRVSDQPEAIPQPRVFLP